MPPAIAGEANGGGHGFKDFAPVRALSERELEGAPVSNPKRQNDQKRRYER